MYVKRNIEARSFNDFCVGKAINITYSEHVFWTLVIPQEERMRDVILSSVACQDLQYCPTLSHKRYDFQENVIGHKMCVFISSTNFVRKFLIQRKIQRDIIRNVRRCSCKVPTFVTFQWKWNLSTVCRQILKYKIYWKSFYWEPNFSMRTRDRKPRRG
jgi:hypothetical protein